MGQLFYVSDLNCSRLSIYVSFRACSTWMQFTTLPSGGTAGRTGNW